MIYIIIIFLSLFGLSVINPKGRILSFVWIIIFMIFFSLSQDDYDYWMYMNSYEKISYSPRYFEPLFDGFMRVCSAFGMNYTEFRFAVSGIAFLILYSAIVKLTPNVNYVWSLYFIYSMMFDAVMIRYAITIGLVIWMIIYLLKSDINRKYLYKCLCICFICGLIHSSQWLLLLFPIFWKILVNSKHKWIVMGILAVVYLATPAFGGMMFNVLSMFTLKEDLMNYYGAENAASVLGAIFNVLKYGLYTMPMWFYCYMRRSPVKELRVRLNSGEFDYGIIRGKYPNAPWIRTGNLRTLRSLFVNNIEYINLTFAIVLIPQFFAVNYDRLFKVLIIINYCFLSLLAYRNRKIDFRVVAFGFIYALSFCWLFFIYFSKQELFRRIVLMHLTTNPVFDYFY